LLRKIFRRAAIAATATASCGLTVAETSEFETLDKTSPMDDGHHSRSAAARRSPPGERWLELYLKHDQAWKIWEAPNVERPSRLAEASR
jgi:hypothetical protein